MHLLLQFFIVILISKNTIGGFTPEITAESTNERMYKDYIGNLLKSIGEAQVSNMYNMLKVFSQSTLEQAELVVNYIEEHANLTRSEARSLRMAGNASLDIIDCIQKKELDLLQAFRHTGYNLHHCIRSAQLNYEKAYQELTNKLDVLKRKTVAAYRNHTNILSNCVDSDCNMKVLLQSVVQCEKLREELSQEVSEGNNLTSRYIVNKVAMGCVSASMQQIHGNYNTGKDLMARCFHQSQGQHPNGANQTHQQHVGPDRQH